MKDTHNIFVNTTSLWKTIPSTYTVDIKINLPHPLKSPALWKMCSSKTSSSYWQE